MRRCYKVPTMKIPTPTDIEDAAHQAGMNMTTVCTNAGVARSTFARAKSGETTLNLRTLARLVEAIPDHEPT
jgi:predicted transcriptional regulator